MSTYQPDAEAARLAPACVCSVASRVMWLRQIAHEFDATTRARLAPFLAPLPFEAELLSGRMELVDLAIKKIGLLHASEGRIAWDGLPSEV
jgi:hypothetical protein